MHGLIVVTGLWRCGSSLMMQILDAGGISTISTSFYDEFNPRGYYEIDLRTHERVHAEIVSGQHKDHAIKWLIPFWPEKEGQNIIDLADHIIFMQRNHNEIVESTNKKWGISPYKRKLQIMERDAKNKLLEKGLRPIFLNYNDILVNPENELWPVSFLLEDWESALQVIDEKLYKCKCRVEEDEEVF